MVDERGPTGSDESPVTPRGDADDPAEAAEAEIEAIGGGEESERGRAAPAELETGSAAPQPPGAAQAPAPASPSAPDAPDGERERRLKAGLRQARICEPLWKVRRPFHVAKEPLIPVPD